MKKFAQFKTDIQMYFEIKSKSVFFYPDMYCYAIFYIICLVRHKDLLQKISAKKAKQDKYWL